jgi:hypothetical protein
MMVRTHDDALALLRYAVPGAVVELEPIWHPGEQESSARARRYVVTIPAARVRVSDGDTYSLPCLAAPLARRARDLADACRAAAAR